MAGLTDPGGIIGAKNAAHWLFIIFAVTPLIAFFTAQIVVSRTSKN